MKNLILLPLLLISFFAKAQSNFPVNPVQPTPAKDRIASYQQKLNAQKNSILKNLEFKSIGPTVMSGRVVDIAVNPDDPTIFYAAYASGGLWKTTNNGISFTPIFDNESTLIIGSIAVDWKNSVIIVGTGENSSSRSAYAGMGVFKSTNDGKTWTNIGLEDSHRSGKVLIHPKNPDIIWIGALGHSYSSNPERGVFKTTDGGTTWKQTLFIDDLTGIIDMAIDPNNENILYAASWFRERRAWNFVEKGKTSGIYKSTDGGDSWKLISTEQSGFPTGNKTGRIGLSISNNGTLFALVDNHNLKPVKEDKEKPAVNPELLKSISREDFLELNESDLKTFLSSNNFPEKYTAQIIFTLVKEDKIKPADLVDFVYNDEDALFNTQIIGGELYKSTDGGNTFAKTHKDYLNDFVYTYGYYFGNVRVNPNNTDEIYLLGVPILKSTDGGKTFFILDKGNLHADHHSLWINPYRNGHIINGNDGGINISYDGGNTWFKANTPAVGQCYSVNSDTKDPFNVYAGFQDNGVWYGSYNYNANYDWYQSGHYPYKSIMGGDGMQVAIDTRNNDFVYTGYQFGNYFRIQLSTEENNYITPQRNLGEPAYRFNWQSPIMLSTHNQDIVYFASNKLFRSQDKGETFQEISPDLTKGKVKGNVPYGTITTIHESPVMKGIIYTGSDDGLVYVTTNGGIDWKNINYGLPEYYYISRVFASNFDSALVYVSLNGYRWDNFESLIYKSYDFGNTWQRIGLDLPLEPVNVIKEDRLNKNLLYVGTDAGLYISINGGEKFEPAFKGMPNVPVHDLNINPVKSKLLIGTHGRSIYIADINPLQLLNDSVLQKPVFIYPISSEKYSRGWGKKTYTWEEPKSPEKVFIVFSSVNGNAAIKIKNENKDVIKEFTGQIDNGLNYISYDLSIDSTKLEEFTNGLTDKPKSAIKPADTEKIYLLPGKYTLEIILNDITYSEIFEIKSH